MNMKKKVLPIILVVLFSLIVFVAYFNRIDDLDLWWHLELGELIFQTHALPGKDDFAYTTYVADDIARHMGLDVPSASGLPFETKEFWINGQKRSWLADLVLYISMLTAGFLAIGVLKSLIFVLAYVVLYLAMLKRGSDPLAALFVIALVAVIGIDFNFTRPQIFSFLLFPGVLYVLYDFRKGGRSLYLLPLLMVIWANLHGAFILGAVIIFVFSAGELTKYAVSRGYKGKVFSALEKPRLKKLLLISLISILASMVNPNGYKTFLFPVIQTHSVFLNIEEYARPMLYEYHAYWLLLSLVVISLIILALMRRLDLTELLISAAVLVPSIKGIRFIPFFALGTGVFLSNALSLYLKAITEWGALEGLRGNRWLARIPFRRVGGVAVVVLCLIILARMAAGGRVIRVDVNEDLYPSGAVAFLKENKVPGKMFNLYNWGGYLIWQLYPEYRVFIDGRNTSENAFVHYQQIIWAKEGESHVEYSLWKELLDAYDVNFILVSGVSTHGVIYTLTDRLYSDSDWALVYADGISLIFVRSASANQQIISRHGLPKTAIVDELIAECERGIRRTPATWGYYEILGKMYLRKNRYTEALQAFRKYLSMNPYNEEIRKLYDILGGSPQGLPPGIPGHGH